MAVGDKAREAMGLATRSTTEIETTPLDRRIAFIRSLEASFTDAVASGLSPKTLVRDAITAVRNTPDLVDCEPMSLAGALMSAGQLGLRPNVPSLGHGWVLPFWSGKRQRREAQWVLGYQGMVELGYKSGLVAKITADTIYANETYRVRRGTDDELIHEPILDESQRGEPVAHYAVVWLQTGRPIWRVMGDGDVRKIMERMASRDRQKNIVGPWKDDYVAMAQKTPLRALWRFMPKTEILSLALTTDGAVRELDVTKPARDVVTLQHADEDTGEAEPAAAGSAGDPVDAEVVPDPEPVSDAHSAPATSGREQIKPTPVRRGLIATIEQAHGADWGAAAEIVTGGKDVYALDVATTDELRAMLAITTEQIREFLS